MTYETGQTFSVAHPFCRDTFSDKDCDYTQSPTWRPGIRQGPWRNPDGGSELQEADAMGHQLIEIVGTYRPGKWPVRVFYTRQWRDPDGKVFGKPRCFIKSQAAFTRLLSGYRVYFDLHDRGPVEIHDPAFLEMRAEAQS